MFYTFSAVTVKEVQAVVAGSTPSITIQLTYGLDASLSGSTEILSSATAITNSTVGQNFVSFNSSNIYEHAWVKLITSAKSGTVNILHVSMIYSK
jgi:hypothetical protein